MAAPVHPEQLHRADPGVELGGPLGAMPSFWAAIVDAPDETSFETK
jgi:hypothetical protein